MPYLPKKRFLQYNTKDITFSWINFSCFASTDYLGATNIEDENERLLFDAGYSDAFIRNAQAMNIDLIHKSIPVHEVGVGLKIEIE